MAGSLGDLRRGLESHEKELAALCADVGRRAEEASKEMLGFKEKVRVHERLPPACPKGVGESSGRPTQWRPVEASKDVLGSDVNEAA